MRKAINALEAENLELQNQMQCQAIDTGIESVVRIEIDERRSEVENLKDDLQQQIAKSSELQTQLIDTRVDHGDLQKFKIEMQELELQVKSGQETIQSIQFERKKLEEENDKLKEDIARIEAQSE